MSSWKIIPYISFFFLGFIGTILWFSISKNQITATEKPLEYATLIQESTISLTFVGDMMLDRGVRSSVQKNFNGNYDALFAFTDYLKNSDIVIGNLEGPASDQGKNVGSRFSFRMDPIIIKTLAQVPFHGLSLANNHAGDWTVHAFADTINRLRENAIIPIGIKETKSSPVTPAVFTRQGITVAVFGCTDVGPAWLVATETRPGIVLCNDSELLPAISDARTMYDSVIITPHWGEEYVGFSKRQETLAKGWIDAGAHAVIGHHPHVIQATQWYNNGFIAYSLGNFIFDQYFSPETMQGMVVTMTLNRDGIVSVDTQISPLSKTYQPQPLRPITESDIVTKNSTASTQETVFTCPTGTGENYSLKPVSPIVSIGKHIPMNLVPIRTSLPTGGRDFCLIEQAKLSAENMFREAKDSNHTYLITSAWRSNERQEKLFQADQAILAQNPDQLPQAAPAGTSEHQLGTTIDIVATNALTLETFSNSNAYQWMVENAHRFGFVQSYQAGFESITGYKPEPWHWRYVGIEHATAVRDQGIALVTYLENLDQSKPKNP